MSTTIRYFIVSYLEKRKTAYYCRANARRHGFDHGAVFSRFSHAVCSDQIAERCEQPTPWHNRRLI